MPYFVIGFRWVVRAFVLFIFFSAWFIQNYSVFRPLTWLWTTNVWAILAFLFLISFFSVGTKKQE